MGNCYSTKENRKLKDSNNKISAKDTIKSDNNKDSKFLVSNNAIQIMNEHNNKIIKNINDIQGKEIIIQDCKNCTIMIMDLSSKILITKCFETNIFLAPCSGSLIIHDNESINIISTSLNFEVSNTLNSQFYIYSLNNPKIKNCNNLIFGINFTQYVEFSDFLKKSKLNPWLNSWSQIIVDDDKKDNDNKQFNYASESNKENILKIYKSNFDECFISLNQYQYLPYEYGYSYINFHEWNKFINFLLIVREEYCQDSEILKFLNLDELDKRKCKLIKCNILNYDSQPINEIKQRVSNPEIPLQYFNKEIVGKSENDSVVDNNNNNVNFNLVYNPSRKSQLDLTLDNKFINYNNIRYLKKNQFLFMWIIQDSPEESDSIEEYINENFEMNKYVVITSNDINKSESEFYVFIKEIFNLK